MEQEQTLLAHFTFPEQAEKARDALVEAGVDVVQVDRVGPAGGAHPIPLVEWGRYGYELEGLDDKWTSAAAWDDRLQRSGVDAGEAVLLTVVVDGERAGAARDIIRRFGGTF